MFHIKLLKPKECSKAELQAFQKMVESGNEIDTKGLSDRIARSYLLAFGYEDSILACVGGLKIPTNEYKSSIFRKAEISELSTSYTYEFGWLYTSEEFRGRRYAKMLMEKLLTAVDGSIVFSTVRTDNLSMIAINESLNFFQKGNDYPSTRGDYRLLIFSKK